MEKLKISLLLQLFCIFTVGVSIALANQTERIGKIKTSQPEADIRRENKVIAARAGSEVFANDILETGKAGNLSIIFRDGAMLTLGPSSEFTVSEYVFNPVEKSTSFISKMKKGAASYISGAIGRINPESVRIETPTAYLGLRGTKILINVD